MPPRPYRPCRKPGCTRLTQDPSGYCEAHVAWGAEKAEKDLAARRKKADERRGTAHERGYSEAWRKARKGFLRKNPVCVGCGRPATVVDHIVPHRGDKDLFWDRDNWQPLCVYCHNAKTARGE